MFSESVKEKILDHCRKTGGVRVNVYKKDNPQPFSGLSFDINGKAKTIEGNVIINTYIENIIKYSRKDIIIKLDDIDFMDILEVKALPLITPEPINTDQ